MLSITSDTLALNATTLQEPAIGLILNQDYAQRGLFNAKTDKALDSREVRYVQKNIENLPKLILT